MRHGWPAGRINSGIPAEKGMHPLETLAEKRMHPLETFAANMGPLYEGCVFVWLVPDVVFWGIGTMD